MAVNKTSKRTVKTTTPATPTKKVGRKQDPVFSYVTNFLVSNQVSPTLVTEWNAKQNEFNKMIKKQTAKESNKKVKDPNAPKKAMSAYICFCNDKREAIKKSNPDMKVTEVIQEIAKQWANVKTKKEVEKYKKRAQQDKQRYLKEMENYTPPDNLTKPQKVTKPRSRSGYQIFCAEQRPKEQKANPEMKGKEILTLLGKKWSSLTEKQKDKYKAKAEAEKAKMLEEAANEEEAAAEEESDE